MFLLTKGKQWTNWSETVHSQPSKIVYPKSIDEVCQIVKRASDNQEKIRVVGAGHSFTPIAATTGYLMSLDYLAGVLSIDEHNQTAEVLAGTRLYDLTTQLAAKGFAQENLGDINVQSLAGAILTGTHGTGVKFGNIATQVVALTLVKATGELLTITPDHQEVPLQAAAISLGLLGVVVKVTIRIVPAPMYCYISNKYRFDDLLNDLPDLIEENRHFECFLFPYSDMVQVKTMNLSEEKPRSLRKHRLYALVMENYAFKFLSETARMIPKTSRSISRLSARAIGSSIVYAKSHDLFATQRRVKFREMEYSIPLEYLIEALAAMKAKIEQMKYNVHFPIEVRIVKGDDIWLSTAYGRNSAFIAIHMYKGMAFKQFFYDMDQVLTAYQARPHWGKMHEMKLSQLHSAFPKLHQFLDIRKHVDPEGVFLNSYFTSLFELNIEDKLTVSHSSTLK